MSEIISPRGPIPVGSIGRKSFGWWGMITLVMTEGALFAYLLFTYYYFAAQYGREWLPDPLPGFALSAPNTVILILSSVAMWWGERSISRNDNRSLIWGLAAALVLGVVFLIIQGFEWQSKPFTLASGPYGSMYFTLTGFHMAHLAGGALALLLLLVWALFGYFDAERYVPVSVVALYWHFVDVVWLTLFFTFYITPRLG